MIVLHVGLTLAALALFAVAARYAFFAALALLSPPAPLPPREPTTRFGVLIPAHNEAHAIRASVEAALKLEYPRELFRVLVLADNCDDDTARLAREAGAEAIERVNPGNPGKGPAIAWALEHHFRPDEALVIVDADSRPAPDYLLRLDRALGRGYGAAQGFNGAANADESSLAALSALTAGMKNGLHYAGKTAAGRPVPLMNGLAISAATLRAHPWRSFTIVEDFETYLRLVDEGVQLRFVPEARMLSPRASKFASAAGQKARWSGGQSRLARDVAWPLAIRALRERSWNKLSAACDLLLPGYATLTGSLAVVALLGWLLPGAHPSAGFALAGLILMAAQFAAGLARMKWTPQLAKAIALAPFYIVWKAGLAVRSAVKTPTKW